MILLYGLEIGDYEKTVNRQTHKYNAYRKAAQSIKSVEHKLTYEEAKKLVKRRQI